MYDVDGFHDISRVSTVPSVLLYAAADSACQPVQNLLDGAILRACEKYDVHKNELLAEYPSVGVLAFESRYKVSLSAHIRGEDTLLFVKGSPDHVMQKCVDTQLLRDAQKICNQNDLEGSKIIAVATRKLSQIPIELSLDMQRDMEFIGLIFFSDSLSFETKENISLCRLAGIKTILMSNDHFSAVSSVSQTLGCAVTEGTAIISSDFDRMGDDEKRENIEKSHALVDFTAEQKTQAIKLCGDLGGVSAFVAKDPTEVEALQKSDVGVASADAPDVCVANAGVIVQNLSFESLKNALCISRGLFQNLQKLVTLSLVSNISFTMLCLLCLFTQIEITQRPMIYIFLFVTLFPFVIFGLSLEPYREGLMRYAPRNKKKSLFSKRMVYTVLTLALSMTVISFGTALVGSKNSFSENVPTMMFFEVGISLIFLGFSMRSKYLLKQVGFFSNRWMIFCGVTCLVLLLVFLFVPAFMSFLGLVYIPVSSYFTCLMSGVLLLSVSELHKYLYTKFKKRRIK